MSCQRLEPQLGVPTAELYGQLTVFTGNLKVTIYDPDEEEGRALLRTLRPMGRTGPVTSLAPPTKAMTSWVDRVCGRHPGDSREAPQPPQIPGSNTTVPGFTVLAVPYFLQAGHIRTSLASPLLMFIATAPPRLEPTTTSGLPSSNSAWAMRTASSKSSSGKAGFKTSWP